MKKIFSFLLAILLITAHISPIRAEENTAVLRIQKQIKQAEKLVEKRCAPEKSKRSCQQIKRRLKTLQRNLVRKQEGVQKEIEAIKAMKDRVIELVNIERAKEGLSPLRANVFLEKAAQDYSENLQKNDFLDHIGLDGSTPLDRIRAAGYFNEWDTCQPCQRGYGIAENLGKGYQTPEAAVEGWMNSEGHRLNILTTDHNEIGIGIIKIGPGNKDGYAAESFIWVQNFGYLEIGEDPSKMFDDFFE